MKCPKCQYISFDSPERCRNCGYDFGLAVAAPRPAEVTFRDAGQVDGPLPDFALGERGTSAPRRGDAPPSQTPIDLPLFNEPVPGLDDTPLISAPQPPRPPLSVRRTTPDPSRIAKPSRARSGGSPPPAPAATTPAAPGEPLPDLLDVRSSEARGPGAVEAARLDPRGLPAHGEVPPTQDGEAADGPVPVGRRLLAGLVDLALIAAIDLAVVHFTLAVVRYPWSRLVELPLLPLVAFCAMLNAGYLVLFTTASGQTVGKVLLGLRVVADDSRRVPVTQAAVRTALSAVSLAVLGLGYLPALVGADRRALHDRLSNTRVVRA